VTSTRSKPADALRPYTVGMSLSASEFYEAGLVLTPSVRKDVALRLLDSVEVAGQESVDDAWNRVISARFDAKFSGAVETVLVERVFVELALRQARRGSRSALRGSNSSRRICSGS